MIRKTYRVGGMSCPNCAMKIEGIEDELPGIRRIEASYRQCSLVVEFDETLVSEEKILSAVKRLGYAAQEK
jgi:Cu+-exporting ATPase